MIEFFAVVLNYCRVLYFPRCRIEKKMCWFHFYLPYPYLYNDSFYQCLFINLSRTYAFLRILEAWIILKRRHIFPDKCLKIPPFFFGIRTMCIQYMKSHYLNLLSLICISCVFNFLYFRLWICTWNFHIKFL